MGRVSGNKKLEEKVRQDLALIINYKLNDPRVKLVSVTRVELLQDGQYAKVHYSVLGGDTEKRKVQKALEHARGHIQRLLGQGLHTRHTPKLTFCYDPGIEQGIRVGQIFDQLAAEREEQEAADGDEEAEADTVDPPAEPADG